MTKHSAFLFNNWLGEQEILEEAKTPWNKIYIIQNYSKVYEWANDINKILDRILSSNDEQELIKNFVNPWINSKSDFVKDLLLDDEISIMESYAWLEKDYIKLIKSSLKQILKLNDLETVISYIWSKDEIWSLENPLVNSLKKWIQSTKETQEWYMLMEKDIKPILYEWKYCVYFCGNVIDNEDYWHCWEAHYWELPDKKNIINLQNIFDLLPDNKNAKTSFLMEVLGLSKKGLYTIWYWSEDKENNLKLFLVYANNQWVSIPPDFLDDFWVRYNLRIFLNKEPF